MSPPAMPAANTALHAFRLWQTRSSPTQQAIFGLYAFTIAFFYVVQAASVVETVWHEIPAHHFYQTSDFARQIWQAGQALRAGQVTSLYRNGWLYPPSMGLIAWLTAFLPLAPGFWAWRAFSLLTAGWLLWQARLPRWVILLSLFSPAAWGDFWQGQNGTLTGGLITASLLMADRKPKLSGILAGLLIIKPQIAILLPAALLRRRHGPLLATACLTAAAVILLSVLLAGPHAWRLFLTIAQPNARAILALPFNEIFKLSGFTVYFMMRGLGLTPFYAAAVQAVSTLAAFALVWRVWQRTDANNTVRAAITCFAWILATPYGFPYDLTAFSTASIMLLPYVNPNARLALFILWLSPISLRIVAFAPHISLIPLAAVAGIIIGWPQLNRK